MNMEDFERPYRKVSAFKAVILFLFRRKDFVDMVVEHDKAYSLATDKDLRERFLKGEYKPDEVSIRETAEIRTTAIRRSLFFAAIMVASSATLALISGWILQILIGDIPSWLNYVLQILGAGALLCATIWELGFGIRSFGGESLPERVHQWFFRSLYVFGTFCFFLVYRWSL
jgi:hypothetical protein